MPMGLVSRVMSGQLRAQMVNMLTTNMPQGTKSEDIQKLRDQF